MKTYVASHLKDMNRRKVYRILSECEVTSKSEISRLTEISAPTVIKIINFFQEKGLVEDLGDGEAVLGRKPQMLRLRKNRYYAIGVIFEGDYLKLGITNLRNEIVCLKKTRVREPFEKIMSSTLYHRINELLVESNIRLSDVLGIGIGLPGIYDATNQTIIMAPLIGIEEKTDISPMIQSLEERYHLPVLVDNDLNMEVQGEFISKHLSERDDLIYLSIGTGIGSGVMLNGKLRRGIRYMCGEVGYMSFQPDYETAVSKMGWLEGQVNINALCERYHSESLSDLDESARQEAIQHVSDCVAMCINNMIMCYDCGYFSVGGEMFHLLGEKLFDAISQKVKKLSVLEPNLYRAVGGEPGVIGAAGVVLTAEMNRMLEE